VAVFELDLERRAGEGFDDAADQAQRIFLGDGSQGLTAFLAAAALASARRGNGNSLARVSAFVAVPSPCRPRSPRERRFHARFAPLQVNFAIEARVVGGVMLTGAIVFGMVGVAAGFTWDYVINRGK
jgi:hypothetical protein